MNSKNIKIISISLAVFFIILLVSAVYFTYFGKNYSIIYLPEFSKIITFVTLSHNKVLIAGNKILENGTEGLAGIYYINNNSFVNLNLNSFNNGSIYSVAYNGSSYLFVGSKYIGSELVPVAFLYNNGKIYNYSKYLSSFSPGQAFAADWFNKTWLIGGDFILYEDGGAQSIMFLIGIKGNESIDYTINISNELGAIPQGEAYTINNNSNQVLIGGSYSIYTSVFLLSNKELNVNISSILYRTPGAILAASPYENIWLAGGLEFTPQSAEAIEPYPVPFLITIHNNNVSQINLLYKIGIVTSIATKGDKVALAIRIPFSESNNVTGGTVILYGKLSSLYKIYEGDNISINQLAFVHNYIFGVGYKITRNNSIGVLLLYKV